MLEHRHEIGEDVVALTFDDGPSPWIGPILDLLTAHQGHATFFALGCLAESDGAEQTFRRILETGSEIGNHTFSHPSLPKIDDDSIRDELERAGSVIEEASGTTLRYWRPPFFHVDERVRKGVSPLAAGSRLLDDAVGLGVGRRPQRGVRHREAATGIDRVHARRPAAGRAC